MCGLILASAVNCGLAPACRRTYRRRRRPIAPACTLPGSTRERRSRPAPGWASTIEGTFTRKRKQWRPTVRPCRRPPSAFPPGQLERHRAGGGQRRPRQPEGRELVGLAFEQDRRDGPRSATRLDQRPRGGTVGIRTWNGGSRRRSSSDRLPERLHQPADLRPAAAGQHDQHRLARAASPGAPPEPAARRLSIQALRSIRGWPT